MTHSFWIDVDEQEGHPIDADVLEEEIHAAIQAFMPDYVNIDYMAEQEVTIHGSSSTGSNDSTTTGSEAGR